MAFAALPGLRAQFCCRLGRPIGKPFKTRALLKPAFLAGILTFGCVLQTLNAQSRSLTVLHYFSGTDGDTPVGSLAMDNAGHVFGTTETGGKYNAGTLFQWTDAGLTTLWHFDITHGELPFGSVLADTDGNVYGTTLSGGAGGKGTVFRWDRELGFQVIKHFYGGKDGLQPFAGLTRDAEGNLYGSTFYGGNTSCEAPLGCGTLFKVDPSGAFTRLFAFSGTDGWGPNANLYRVQNRLYGTTVYLGHSSAGQPFSIGVDGSGFSDIPLTDFPYNFLGGLVKDREGNLWGTMMRRDPYFGGIYKIDPAGNFSVVFMFNGSNGAFPASTLVIDEARNTLYGTTQGNGTWVHEGSGPGGYGNVFSFDITTGALTVLHTFDGSDGKNPFSGLIRDPSGNLYGVTPFGGKLDKGVLYRVTP